jgi:enoyl-CoA hydratase/carnithine racemase
LAALNALCSPLMSEVAKALEEFQADSKVGAIVITGSERAFAGTTRIATLDGSEPELRCTNTSFGWVNVGLYSRARTV